MELKTTVCPRTASNWVRSAIDAGCEGALHFRLENPSGSGLHRARYFLCVFDPDEPKTAPAKHALSIMPGESPAKADKKHPPDLRADGKEMTAYLAYTDGGCWPNPGGPGGAGAVLRSGEERWERAVHLGPTTCNRAELMAVREALLMIPDRSQASVHVGSDSEYVIGVIYRRWKARANLDLVNEIRSIADECAQFRMFHVRGHSGVEGNETAHNLACRGAASPDLLPLSHGRD